MDTVYGPRTLEAAWKRGAANRGAAGVARVSGQRFARQAPRYLAELGQELQEGSYRPELVRRVHIVFLNEMFRVSAVHASTSSARTENPE